MAGVGQNIDVTKYLKKANFFYHLPHSVSEIETLWMLQLLEGGRDSDVTLVVAKGAEFKIRVKAHKSILTAASPVFRAHDFLHETGMMQEHDDYPQIIVSLGAMTLECLELFLVLIYMGDHANKLVNNWQVDKYCYVLMDRCHAYQLTYLVPTLTASVKRILTRENCWLLSRHTLDLKLTEREGEQEDEEGQNADVGVWEALWHECYKFAFANYANIVPPNQSTPDLQVMFAAMRETIMSMSGSTRSEPTRVWRRGGSMHSLESCGSNTIYLEESV